jgi:hypothetical protein
MHDFQKFDETSVRADSYFLARTQGECGACFRSTALLALALPRDHETWYAPNPDDPWDRGDWQVADGTAFIFDIERLNPEVARRVKEPPAIFLPERNGKKRGGNWTNHCARCGAAVNDQYLHCEFDAAFVPTSTAAAARITLTHVREPLLASAGGYTFWPEFFAAMRRG